jgi:hypothetical protein
LGAKGKMAKLLHEIQKIRIVGSSGDIKEIPSYLLVSKIPIILHFLSLIVSDWERDSNPKQMEIDKAAETSEPIFELTTAMQALEPIFLKCLFSYGFFFVATNAIYRNVHISIHRANADTNFHVSLQKPPKIPLELQKLVKVRNWSIAHLGEANASELDQLSAMYWSPTVVSKESSRSWDLNRMSFGSFKLRLRSKKDGSTIESTDLELENIPRLHEITSKYFSSYDSICVENIEELRKLL